MKYSMEVNKVGSRIRNIIIGIFIFLIIILAIVFFSKRDFDGEKKSKIIFIPKVVDKNNEFWTEIIEGAEFAANEFNISLEIMGPDTEDNINLQSKYILEAIEKQPDAIIISPISYTKMNIVINSIKEKNIKLIFVDSKINDTIEECFIGTDNFEEGKNLGKYISRQVDKESKVAIISHVTDSYTANERKLGVINGFGENEKYIVEVVNNANTYEKAFELTKILLEKNSEINIIIGLNLYSTIGAARAVDNLGLSNDIEIFGFDSNKEGIRYLEEDIINGIIVQRAFNMGYLGVENAYKLINNIAVEDEINSGAKLIIKQNMYEKDSEKLLFPF